MPPAILRRGCVDEDMQSVTSQFEAVVTPLTHVDGPLCCFLSQPLVALKCESCRIPRPECVNQSDGFRNARSLAVQVCSIQVGSGVPTSMCLGFA